MVVTTSGDGVNEEPSERDAGLLDEIRDLYTELDPMPAELVALSRFALELDEADFELARPDPLRELAGTTSRGSADVQHVRFAGDLLTVLVSVRHNDDGTRRVDGHLEPGGAHLVRVRTGSGTLSTRADEDGRFTVGRIAPGPAQFVVRLGDTTVISSALQV